MSDSREAVTSRHLEELAALRDAARVAYTEAEAAWRAAFTETAKYQIGQRLVYRRGRGNRCVMEVTKVGVKYGELAYFGKLVRKDGTLGVEEKELYGFWIIGEDES